jgi:hypothetical protein
MKISRNDVSAIGKKFTRSDNLSPLPRRQSLIRAKRRCWTRDDLRVLQIQALQRHVAELEAMLELRR